MNFTSGITQAKRVFEIFVKGPNNPTPSPSSGHPRGVVFARYFARLVILGIALFIFMIWPVDTYDPEGFDAWSARMEALPEEVWYVLLGVILSWGTTEVVAARAMGGKLPSNDNNPPYGEDDDEEYFDNGPLDGRFSNVEADESFFNSGAPNQVIEDWQDKDVS